MLEDEMSTLRHCIDVERLEYLNHIKAKGFEPSGLLNLPHQTILRILASQKQLGDVALNELVRSYCQNATYQLSCLDALVRDLTNKVNIPSKDIMYVNKERMKYSDTSMYHRDVFRDITTVFDASRSIKIDNEHGFALFYSSRSQTINSQLSLIILEECRHASVGAMLFYGFNSKDYPGVFFLQKIPIKILAYTFYWMSFNQTIQTMSKNWWEKMVAHEAKPFIHIYGLDDFEMACHHFLLAHELGHTYVYQGETKILDFLYSVGLTDDDIYMPDFPSAYDVNAWARIKSGQGTKRDVCFMLGDMLANLAIISGGISPFEHALMRSFNWSIVAPPSASKRPRGNIVFLRYSMEKDLDVLFTMLEEIFASVEHTPYKTAELMLAMEKNAWDELAGNHS